MGIERYSWAKDKSRFGLKLMQKMGWTEGNGLGREEDGRVKSILVQKHQKQVGIGAQTSSDKAWQAPGTVAAGFNDVLARLAPIGDVPAAIATPNPDGGEDAQPADGTKARKGGRGFYERRRARKNVRSYSKNDLREIFGGIDVWSGLSAVQATMGKTEVNDAASCLAVAGAEGGRDACSADDLVAQKDARKTAKVMARQDDVDMRSADSGDGSVADVAQNATKVKTEAVLHCNELVKTEDVVVDIKQENVEVRIGYEKSAADIDGMQIVQAKKKAELESKGTSKLRKGRKGKDGKRDKKRGDKNLSLKKEIRKKVSKKARKPKKPKQDSQ